MVLQCTLDVKTGYTPTENQTAYKKLSLYNTTRFSNSHCTDTYGKQTCEGTVNAEGKAVNRGGRYGMEVPCVYRLMWQHKYVKMLRNLLDLQTNLSVRNVHKTDDTLKRAKEQEGSRVKKNQTMLKNKLND